MKSALPFPFTACRILIAAVVFLSPAGVRGADFQRDIIPIFEASCFECHSSLKTTPKGGLRLDSRKWINEGGDNGKVIRAGKPEASPLMARVTLPHDDSELMPPPGKGQPLAEAQIALLREWIADGADFGDWKKHTFSAPTPHAGEGMSKAPAASAGPVAESLLEMPSPVTPATSVREAAAQIDRLVEADLKRNGIEPNAPAGEAVFMRRAYLDIVGRIPAYEEARAYLSDDSPGRREALIDSLLDSEGYVSRQFNFMADLLRVRTRMRNVDGHAYQDWIKESIRENRPYDEFVREMLTAEGHIYANPATGYYLRDPGMPLDNMSNTVQTFLGTRLTCAQCHNHPFDKWTQREFYEMAAHTAGIETVRRGNMSQRRDYQQISKMDLDNDVKQAVRNIVRQTRYGYVSFDDTKALRLPDDYQYDDGKAKELVLPAKIFGPKAAESAAAEEIKTAPKAKGRANGKAAQRGKAQAKRPPSLGDPREEYAEWMTSPENPRFALVIANRMWRQAMGVGLIEPVDDLRDDTVPSNPELMAYLRDLMVAVDFDLKAFLRVVYNTQTYQRASAPDAVPAGEAYHFPGPLMRRMSAEQMWDSMLTLLIPDPDERTEGEADYESALDALTAVGSMSPEELVTAAEVMVARRSGGAGEMMSKKGKSVGMRAPDPAAEMMMVNMRNFRPRRPRENDPRWAGFSPQYMRASELVQPAPAGHFLREFGQADRETIDAANTEATATQALQMLNGTFYRLLARSDAVITKNMRETGRAFDPQLEVLFMSIYSRPPDADEINIAKEWLRDAGRKDGMQDIVWALLNTQNFIFIQ